MGSQRPLIYPAAEQRILHPENEQAGIIELESLQVHTVVDAKGHTDLAAYLDRPEIKPRVTFYLPRFGRIQQLLHLNRRSAAGRMSDAWAATVECEDDSHGLDPDDFNPLTESQLEQLIQLGIWLMAHFPRMRRQVTSSARYYPGRAGLCYHSQPMKEKLDETSYNPWTSYQGKECPTNPSIRQLYTVVWPAILNNQFPGGDEMSAEDVSNIMQQLDDLQNNQALMLMLLTGNEFDPKRMSEVDVYGTNDLREDLFKELEKLKVNNLTLAVNVIQALAKDGVNISEASQEDLANLVIEKAQEQMS